MAIENTKDSSWTPYVWVIEDMQPGMRVRMKGRKEAVIYQASWGPGDDVDTYLLVAEHMKMFKPSLYTREEMLQFLNVDGFQPVD